MASGSGTGNGRTPELPRGLIDRRGTPAGKARLTSLRSPRDLTLGGIPKRVFAPNIPAKKEKPKETEVEQKQEKPRDKSKERSDRGRGRGRDGRGRGRGRGRGQDVIQMSSIFEYGPAVEKIKREDSGYSYGGGWRGSGGGGGAGPSGGGGVKVKKYDLDNKMDEILTAFLCDDFVRDDSPEEDIDLAPSILPRELSIVVNREEEDQKPGPSGIKQEPKDDMDASDSVKPPFIDEPRSFRPPRIPAAELLMEASKSGEPRLLMCQLPHVLPGTPALAEEDLMLEGPSSSRDKGKVGEKKDENKPPRCALRDFSEGYLGKLRVRQSGKVELVLGEQVLDVTMGMPYPKLREVVSVRTDEGDSRMTALGRVNQTMIVSPNFQALLQNLKTRDT